MDTQILEKLDTRFFTIWLNFGVLLYGVVVYQVVKFNDINFVMAVRIFQGSFQYSILYEIAWKFESRTIHRNDDFKIE